MFRLKGSTLGEAFSELFSFYLFFFFILLKTRNFSYFLFLSFSFLKSELSLSSNNPDFVDFLSLNFITLIEQVKQVFEVSPILQ